LRRRGKRKKGTNFPCSGFAREWRSSYAVGDGLVYKVVKKAFAWRGKGEGITNPDAKKGLWNLARKKKKTWAA